ncbi:lysozyme [Paraburkholderia sp. J76]|uniref:lysozyme n=1 Tax=Paraburkholderia sp. J76 TaxID=2805439 RepID=UPI002ABD4AE8|nr:lysozyme [Paraburkholderia sp. J76]
MPDPLGSAETNTDPNSCVNLQSGRICKPWTISADGVTFMAVLESGVLNGTYMGLPVVDGMILEVYVDSKGYPTVALGHKVRPEDKLKVGDKITIERAREFTKENFDECESAINRRIKVPLNQYEYDALVSIAYNAGPAGGIAKLVDKVNTGSYAAIPAYIKTYRAHGIEWRRALEARLLKQGTTARLTIHHIKRPTTPRDIIMRITKLAAAAILAIGYLQGSYASENLTQANCLRHVGGGGFGDFDCYEGHTKSLEADNQKLSGAIKMAHGISDENKAELVSYMRAQDEAAKACDLAISIEYPSLKERERRNHIELYDVMAARCRYSIRKQQNEFLHDLRSITTN